MEAPTCDNLSDSTSKNLGHTLDFIVLTLYTAVKEVSMLTKKEIDKRYEDKHREERKAKNATFGTSIPRNDLAKLNAFLKVNKLTKIELVYAGWRTLESQLNKSE